MLPLNHYEKKLAYLSDLYARTRVREAMLARAAYIVGAFSPSFV